MIVLAQLLQMIPFGTGISASLAIAHELGGNDQPTQIPTLIPTCRLTQGAFVLIGGRIGAVFGHKNTLLAAGVWWVIFSLVSGFMKSIVGLCVMRALTGIGGAFMVPNALALLTINFPPGKMRNITVGFFGAMAPIGAAGGGIFSGFFVQLTPWKWLFFFLVAKAIAGAVLFTAFAFVVPGEPEPLDKYGSIDFAGAYFGVAGLILFNFVWNQAPAVGLNEPYIYTLLVVSILHFIAFVLWEWKVAAAPILPLTIWTTPSFTWVILVSYLAFMAVGIVIWYVTLFKQVLRHYTIFASSATYATLAVAGTVFAFLSSQAISRMPAQYILAIGSLGSCVACVLVATTPARQEYWAQIFPALIFTAFGPDFIFTATQIIASNTVRRDQQGIAGSLMGTVLSYSLSTGLGFAGTVEAYTNRGGEDLLRGYRSA
ncbi:putative MFS-type transporter, partial [Lachnellula suecica]